MTAAVPKHADIVIIGGGIMGASIAWQLATHGIGRVVLIERDLIAAGASGRTGALLRQHYSNIPEATLASKSLAVFRNWSEIVGGDVGFVETGLIVPMPTLNGYEDNIPRMQGVTRQLQSLGVAIEMVDADLLREIDPSARFDDVGYATFESQSGYVDAIAATRSMACAATRAGASVLEGITVLGIVASESRVMAVDTSAGRIRTSRVVLAAGPWSPALALKVGLDLPITAQRVQIAIFQTGISLPQSTRTYVDNVAAVFCRPWGIGRTMAGLGGGEVHDLVDPDSYEWRNDPHVPELIRIAMAVRFPSFHHARYLHGHAGLYDMTPDGHPIIGPAGPDGLYVVAGFSGAGFKKGPAVGMAVAGEIVAEPVKWVDLAPFRLDRDWHTPWSPYEYRLASDFGHGF